MKTPSMRALIVLLVAVALTLPTAWSQTGNDLPSAPSAVAQPKTPPPPPPKAEEKKTQNGASSGDVLDTLEAPRNAPAPKAAAPAASAPSATATPNASAKTDSSSDIPADSPTEKIVKRVNEVNVVFTVTDKRGRFIK